MPWLLKTEPSEYSADDLKRDKRTVWSGVANPTALKHLRSMKKGELALIYHTADQRCCVASAQIDSVARPDPTSDDPRHVVVDVRFKSMLKNPVTLAQIKADPVCAGWDLLRIGRLSVVPTSQEIFERILELASERSAD